jgi:hypothetical protein
MVQHYNIPGGGPRRGGTRPVGPACRMRRAHQPPGDRYRDLLLSSDVSLPARSPRYHARSSGILWSLAAGIPVIVPAGSWLARQFLEHHRAHLAGLPDRMRTLAAHVQQSIVWEQHGAGTRPDSSLRLEASNDKQIFSRFLVPAGATHLLVRADFEGGSRYSQILVSELDWHEQPVRDARVSCWSLPENTPAR